MRIKSSAVLVTFILLMSQSVNAQSFGLSIGGSTSPSFTMDGYITKGMESYHLGLSYKFSNRTGKAVSEQLPNYGRTVDGTGDYFWTMDFIYGYWFKDLAVFGEIGAGEIVDFTNYEDNRFNGGGYHMIDRREITAGIGASAGIKLSNTVLFYAGYHTLKEVTFGLRITN
jgi:hypothetical protein